MPGEPGQEHQAGGELVDQDEEHGREVTEVSERDDDDCEGESAAAGHQVAHPVYVSRLVCRVMRVVCDDDHGDSGNGQFITVKEAKGRPTTTTVERVPKPGYGDTKTK